MHNPFEKTSNYFNNLCVKKVCDKKLKMERDKSSVLQIMSFQMKKLTVVVNKII